MDQVIAKETITPPKIDPLIKQVDDAREASENYRNALTAYEIKSAPANKAGLPLPEGKPGKNHQIELGEKLDKVGSEALQEFGRAQRKWVDSGKKDHSSLDE